MTEQIPTTNTRATPFKVEEDLGDRVMWISVSSEMPVDRHFGTEILVHDKKSIDLKFLSGGTAPLLLDHDPRKQIGVVEETQLDVAGRRLRAKVRFGKGSEASEVYDDVMDKIRQNVSIGYMINKTESDEKTEVVRVIGWSPMEVSIVSIPADSSVGVHRTQEPQIKPKEHRMSEDKAIDVDAVVRDAVEKAQATMQATLDKRDIDAEARLSQSRIETSAMMALGARHNLTAKAEEFAAAGKPLSEFRGYVLDNLPKGEPLERGGIGMTTKEVDSFSIMRLMRAKVGGDRERKEASFELSVCNAAAESMPSKEDRGGFRIPTDVMDTWGKRDLSAGTDTQLVGTEHRAGSFIDALRNKMSVMQAGATILGGLHGNVDIPGKNAVSTMTWVSSEGGASTESEPTFRTVSLTPNDASVFTDMTRRMRQQSSPDIEALVRADIVMAIALGLDLAALEGSGSSGQPQGVLNVSGIGKPTAFAGVNPTFAEAVLMETTLANANALSGNLAYIGRTNMYGALKTTVKDAGSGQFVVEPGGTVNGYNYIQSNQGTDGNLYFGNWSDVLIGMWGGLDLVMDESALATSNGLRMYVWQTVDVAVRHAASFAYNNDT